MKAQTDYIEYIMTEVATSHWLLAVSDHRRTSLIAGAWIVKYRSRLVAGNYHMQTVKIILLLVVSAVLYGIVHDQVTARVCVEYFTIGHPPVFQTDSPTLLALGWGVIATWWVGLILGIPLALCARVGSRSALEASDLLVPIRNLLLVMASSSLLFGLAGYLLAKNHVVALDPDWSLLIPAGKRERFLADAWAHLAAYGSGILGGVVLCGWVVRRRIRSEKAKSVTTAV